MMKIGATCSSENSVEFNGLHGVISQKAKFFITTAVRTSDSISHYIDFRHRFV
jgi:hypothetical protein